MRRAFAFAFLMLGPRLAAEAQDKINMSAVPSSSEWRINRSRVLTPRDSGSSAVLGRLSQPTVAADRKERFWLIGHMLASSGQTGSFSEGCGMAVTGAPLGRESDSGSHERFAQQ